MLKYHSITALQSYKLITQLSSHNQHSSVERILHDLPPTRHNLCSIHTVWHTALSRKPLVMDSGKISFKAVLIHWPINASDSVFSYLWQIPDSSRSPYCQVCLRTCNWEVMPPAIWTDLYTDCSLSVLWLLKAINSSSPSYYITCLLSQNSLSHSTMSSVTQPFSLHLNVLPLIFFSCRRFFLFRITNGVTFLPSARLTTSHLFSVSHVLFFR